MADHAARFLQGLAADHGFRLLAVLEDAGDDLDQPGGGFRLVEPGRGQGRQGAGAELLDEHQLVEIGIIEQASRGMAALEDLAVDLGPHGAVELAVFQAVAIDPEVAPVDLFLFDDLDIARLDGSQSWVT